MINAVRTADSRCKTEKGNVEASVGMAIGAGFFDGLVALPGVFSGGEPTKETLY